MHKGWNCGTCVVVFGWLVGSVVAATAPETSLAARYPGDVGLARDPAVLFADDFESGGLKRWDELRGAPLLTTQRPHAGRACVEMEMIRGRDTGCDAKKWFLPGADTVHARFYVRFSANYRYSHHFVTLLANRRQNKWSAFGQAGRRPTGADYFSSGMEPWFAWGGNPPPGEINLYTYFMDMERDPKMDRYWGNGFFPPGPGKGRAGGDDKVVPALDRWQCWEFMVQANSAPGMADGRQAMWLDGKLVGDFRGIRWRDDPQLAINCLWLQHYGFDGGDPTKQHWPERQSVWFDDVVVARSYVGPMVGK